MKKKSTVPETIAYKGYNIPTGKTTNDKKERVQIIKRFYSEWVGENGERKVKNEHLKHFIHVNHDSVLETKSWACLSHQSTLTVLELTYVLKHAVKTEENFPKNNKRQKRYSKMLIMECVVPQLRPYVNIAKLTIGEVRRGGQKLQYCLTGK